MVDKNYCMSSYLALRYIEDDDKDFFEGIHHQTIAQIPDAQRRLVSNAEEIDQAIAEQFARMSGEKLGIMLSGGMDSAILASYMEGCDAYTFRFQGGAYQRGELERAEFYARRYNLKLHYVDINWENTVEQNLEPLLRAKAAPVHSIEPQIMQAAIQAKKDGVTTMVIGESSDLIFGGMNQLLDQDWSIEDFMRRYIFLQPADVLTEPVDMRYLFERYRSNGDRINFLQFMDEIFSVESSSSYYNAFCTAEMPYLDPYAVLKMAEPLDLLRVRRGEPKYLIRELFTKKYSDILIPQKIPMPRPVDFYFKDWKGPKRDGLLPNLDMNRFSGNQKWQLFCLEYFLNMMEQSI